MLLRAWHECSKVILSGHILKLWQHFLMCVQTSKWEILSLLLIYGILLSLLVYFQKSQLDMNKQLTTLSQENVQCSFLCMYVCYIIAQGSYMFLSVYLTKIRMVLYCTVLCWPVLIGLTSRCCISRFQFTFLQVLSTFCCLVPLYSTECDSCIYSS